MLERRVREKGALERGPVREKGALERGPVREHIREGTC